MQSLESLLEALIVHDVEFVIVGGFAAIAHGSSLVTQDLDVCCSFSRENLVRLGKALEDFAPVHRMSPAHPALDVRGLPTGGFKNLYLQTTLGQLDCMSEVSELGPYGNVVKCSEVLVLNAGSCRVLSLDALIRCKESMTRPRDQAQLHELKAIRERLAQEGGADPEDHGSA